LVDVRRKGYYKRTGFGWPKEQDGTLAQMHLCVAMSKDEAKLVGIAPTMPVISSIVEKQSHKSIIPDYDNYMAFLCVARTVTKKEAAVNPEAAKAMDKEWEKLEKQVALVIDEVCE